MRYCKNCGKELPRGRYNTCSDSCFQELTEKRQRELDEKFANNFPEHIPSFVKGTKSMSKPDFFLPFHLPMIIEKENCLNIEHKQEFYLLIPKTYKALVEIERLRNGVYQTMRMPNYNVGTYDFFRKLFPFSISLN